MIELFVQSRYHVERKLLRSRADAFLKKAGINPKSYSVSIAVVGDRKMASLHREFAHKQGTTPVLAFPLIQSGYEKQYRTARKDQDATNTSQTLLGEVVVSYPQTLIFAADENKLVDDKLAEFVEHGITQLLRAAS